MRFKGVCPWPNKCRLDYVNWCRVLFSCKAGGARGRCRLRRGRRPGPRRRTPGTRRRDAGAPVTCCDRGGVRSLGPLPRRRGRRGPRRLSVRAPSVGRTDVCQFGVRPRVLVDLGLWLPASGHPEPPLRTPNKVFGASGLAPAAPFPFRVRALCDLPGSSSLPRPRPGRPQTPLRARAVAPAATPLFGWAVACDALGPTTRMARRGVARER